MKKACILLSVVLLATASCQKTPQVVPVDIEAEKSAIASLIDKFNLAFNAKDVPAMVAFLTEDALCCGTDPSEFWNKEQITDLWTQTLADTALKINYSYSKREIRLATDGNSAIVVEQYVFPLLSAKIPLRNIYNVVKTDETWMVDFISWNFIPRNEDIPKLNKAVE
jgi:ketosteroid isomerase-like protein